MTLLRSLLVVLAVLAPTAAPSEDERPAPTIDTEFSAKEDGRIERRLETLLSTLEPFGRVRMDVSDGIVTLQGTVAWEDDRERAGEIASNVEGVVFVQNQIETDPSLAVRLGPVVERLRDRLYDLLAALPLLGAALVVVALFWLAARFVGRLERPFRRVSSNPLLRDLLRQTTRLAILFCGLLLALEVLEATAFVGAVLGTAGVAGIAIGFAFRNVMENYLAGILLSLRQPFAPHDHVRIGPHEGKVVRLTSRATVLMTLDGNHLNVPNAVVFREAVLNFTRNPERRFEFGVGVGTDENLADAQRLGLGVLEEMEGVLDEPSPFAHVEALGDFSVTIRFYAWVDQSTHDFIKVASEAIRLVKRAFDNAEIDMPEPTGRLRLVNDGDAPRRRPAESDVQQDVGLDPDLDAKIAQERDSDEEEDLLTPGTTLE